jgi:hypothetical protein
MQHPAVAGQLEQEQLDRFGIVDTTGDHQSDGCRCHEGGNALMNLSS